MSIFPKSQKRLAKDLFLAIRDHKEADMKRALKEGADPAYLLNLEWIWGGYHYAYPLEYAVERGYNSVIQQLFELIPEGQKSKIVWESLKTAVEYKNTKAIGMLLDLAPDTKVFVTDYGRTLLHYAAGRGQGEAVEILIAKGVDPAAKDENMNTAAELADKEYPNIAAYIRSFVSDETEKQAATGTWKMISSDEIAQSSESADVGYKLTRIFNFTAQVYTQIAQNMATKAETQALLPFRDLTDAGILSVAHQEFVRQGGKTAFTPQEIRKPHIRNQDKAGPAS